MQLVAKLTVDVIRLRSPPLQLRRKEMAQFSQNDDHIHHTKRASNVRWSRVCDRIAIEEKFVHKIHTSNARVEQPEFGFLRIKRFCIRQE